MIGPVVATGLLSGGGGLLSAGVPWHVGGNKAYYQGAGGLLSAGVPGVPWHVGDREYNGRGRGPAMCRYCTACGWHMDVIYFLNVN